MAHISMIDVPSDTYGEVSTLTRPLVDRLNHASMSRSTFDALSTLLTWALACMTQVEQDLHAHEVHTGVVSAPSTYVPETPVAGVNENEATETSVDASSLVGEGNPVGEDANPATGAANSSEHVPLPAITPDEEAAEAAQDAEIAQAEADAAKTSTRIAKPT